MSGPGPRAFEKADDHDQDDSLLMKPTMLRIAGVLALALTLFLFTRVSALGAPKGERVAFPAGVDHAAWDALLKKYVNEQGLVAYDKWKASPADVKALDDYLAQFGATGTEAKGDDLTASAINAYNAFAIRWILENYPTESILSLEKSFARKAHLVGGKKVALDDIEHGTLRPSIGYRAHSALVCCARSCPPLQRTAYTAAGVDAQITAAYAAWLAREDLNKYDPAKNRVKISSIFKWFKEDFEKAGGVPKILGRYGPPASRDFLAKGGYKIEYLPYRWGLNDQSGRGTDYSRANAIFDSIF